MKKRLPFISVAAAISALVLGTGILPLSSAGASSIVCPSEANLKTVPFEFNLDADYSAQNPLYQGFASNYSYSTFGASDQNKDLALAYLAAGNNQELAKINQAVMGGNQIQAGIFIPSSIWNNGNYLSQLSNGAYVTQLLNLGPGLVLKSTLEYSNDGKNWQEGNFPDPFWIQEYGFGNDSWVRYTFNLNVQGCTNPYILSTNPVQISGINTTPIPTSTFINYVNSIQNKKPSDVGYAKDDYLSFQFTDFTVHDKFVAGFEGWVTGVMNNLSSFNWNAGYFNTHELYSTLGAIGGGTANLNVVGMKPAGCLVTSPTDRGVIKAIGRCQLGLYLQGAYRGSEKYSRYILVGSTTVNQVSPKPTPTPTPTEASKITTHVIKVLNWICTKNKTSLKFSGRVKVCPAGYKLKK